MRIGNIHRTAMLLCLSACAPFTVYAKDPGQLSLSMEHFRDTTGVKADPVDGVTMFSSENGYVEHTGLMRMVWSDEFLTATVNDKTGEKSFQVSAMIIYSGNYRSYDTASFHTAAGTQSVPAIHLSKEVLNCPTGDCTYTERVAFAIDERVLREVAATYRPGAALLWQNSFVAKSGPRFDAGVSTAEIAGFLAKVDGYDRALPVVKANATIAAVKADLGIDGIPVAATTDAPQRAGILVVSVRSGSVAQKAGLIIGDIVYEFGGHAVSSLADLEAAATPNAAAPGAAAPNSVTIKAFRGTERLTLTEK